MAWRTSGVQREHAVKFGSTQAYAYAPGGATVFVRRGRGDEGRDPGGVLRLSPICELVAAAPRGPSLESRSEGAVPRAPAFCAGARATADLGLEDRVVACPGGVGVGASALSSGSSLVEPPRGRRRRRAGRWTCRGRRCAAARLRPRPSSRAGPACVGPAPACGVAVTGAVEFVGSRDRHRGGRNLRVGREDRDRGCPSGPFCCLVFRQPVRRRAAHKRARHKSGLLWWPPAPPRPDAPRCWGIVAKAPGAFVRE